MVVEKLIRRVKETSLSVVQTRLDSIRRKDITKSGIRIYKDAFIGTSGSIGNVDENKLLKDAEEALQNKIAYPCEPTENKNQELFCKSDLPDEKYFVEEMEETLEQLRREQSSFIFSNKINLVEREELLRNSRNLNLSFKDRYLNMELIFKENSSVNVFDGFVGFQGRRYDKREFIKLTNNICNAYLNNVELPKEGVYPVVFSVTEGTTLIKLLMDLNGRSFAMGSSLLSDKRGKTVFSPKFNFYQSLNPEDVAAPFFDAEGTVNEDFRYPLIKEGVVITPFTDKRIAKQFNLPHTGSAVGDYDSVPALPPIFPGFSIGSSGKTVRELLGGEKGIFVLISSGGDFTAEGNFAAPVQVAFLYDGDKLLGRLPQLQVSSNLFEMYGPAFRGVSVDYLSELSMDKCLVMDMKVSKI